MTTRNIRRTMTESAIADNMVDTSKLHCIPNDADMIVHRLMTERREMDPPTIRETGACGMDMGVEIRSFQYRQKFVVSHVNDEFWTHEAPTQLSLPDITNRFIDDSEDNVFNVRMRISVILIQ